MIIRLVQDLLTMELEFVRCRFPDFPSFQPPLSFQHCSESDSLVPAACCAPFSRLNL